ncbi:MAG: hypothetical protein Q9M16_00515, partial [Mariprofundus sp.]|nr:hypothetical protein [Mariprofundus sp.]
MINYFPNIGLRARALLINIAVSLLILALFASLLISHLNQAHKDTRNQVLRLSTSLISSIHDRQVGLDNQLQLLRRNEALMDRLLQAEMENNAVTLPLPKALLNRLNHDLFRLFDNHGVVIARYGRAGDILPASVRSKSLRSFIQTSEGLLFVVQAPVINGTQIMGYVALGDFLDEKILLDLLQGQADFVSVRLLTGQRKQLVPKNNYAEAQPVSLGGGLNGHDVSIVVGVDQRAMFGNSYQFFGFLGLGMLLSIALWWVLYRRFISEVIDRLYKMKQQLEEMQTDDIYPAPEQVVDAIDRVHQGLHRMSLRLQSKTKKIQLERQTLLDITEAAPIWIWKTDTSGQLVFINKLMRDALHVVQDASLRLEEVLKLETADDRQAVYSGKGADAIRRVNIDGAMHDMRIIVKTRKERGASGNVGLAMDMTEHLRLEANAQHGQKMESLGTLVGGVAHNFNNMLAGMVGLVFLVRNKTAGQADVTQYLDKLDTTMARATEMVKQLLAFAHKGMDIKQDVDLGLLIKEAYSMTRQGIPENIHFDANISDASMTVDGNASALQQVFVNLVVNA